MECLTSKIPYKIPLAKTAKMRNKIASFTQHDMECLYEAWERYEELFHRCPHHGLLNWLQFQTFYNKMTTTSKTLVDATASRSSMAKNIENTYELLEEMATNAYQ